jgi:hypothetical protein
MQLPEETILNPNLGWMIAPLAVATDQVAQRAAIDPSIPELMYGIAAVLYAIAAIRRSTREKILSRSKSTSEPLAKSTAKSPDDTIDVR